MKLNIKNREVFNSFLLLFMIPMFQKKRIKYGINIQGNNLFLLFKRYEIFYKLPEFLIKNDYKWKLKIKLSTKIKKYIDFYFN